MYEPAPPEATPAPKHKLTAREQITRLKARLEKLEARESQRDRQLDTRKKIVVGGTVIAEMRTNVNFEAMIVQLLKSRVTRKFDKEAIAEWLPPDSIDSK